MNFTLLDWTIFIALFVILTGLSFFLKRFAKGVAGFLVAGRNVGRYLGLESDSMAGLGAITILAMWQMNYKSGFVGQFWYLLTPLAATVVALTGFAIYRFRQTRAMTLGQFVEMRYSKSTRILFGIVAFTAGVLNMGVFPAAGANFFVNYCGLPDKIITVEPVSLFAGLTFPGLEISLAATLIMIVLVGAAVIICFNGGQVTLVVTNFVQALFVNVMLVAIMIAIYRMFTWEQFAEAYRSAENAGQLLHPFSEKGAADFDKTFYLIGIFSMVYWVISWSPNTLVTSSARDAHEAKMMRVMVEIKKLVYVGLGIGILPLAVFVMMHHPDFADKAAAVQNAVETIPNEQIRSQMLTPAALQFIMPKGLLGAFAGFILFAFLSTHTSYLLAWGGGLIQDVVIPVKGKPLEPKSHMKFIRASVLCVAIFIVLFSILFKQNENLYMFLDLTGGLYLSSAVILLGGLYWGRGTTTGAWAAIIAGAVVSLVGFVFRSKYNTILLEHGHEITVYVFIGFCVSVVIIGLLHLRRKAWWSGLVAIAAGLLAACLVAVFREKLPLKLSGRLIMFHASLISIAIYFIVSELTVGHVVNFNEIFNYSLEEIESRKTRRWWQFAPEVPRGDRILIPCIYGGIVTFVVCFVGGWIYNTTHEVSIESWLKFWHVYVFAMFWLAVAFLIWVVAGGFRDLYRMFTNLTSQEVNVADDGSVEGHHAAGK
jgi:SSS family solute:Na+ symporter